MLVRIAGTGSAEPQLRSLASELGVGSNVEFCGARGRHAKFLSQADILIHASSAAEGMARVVIESQAAGRPVVATDHAGASEAVIDGKTGLITPQHDPSRWAQRSDLWYSIVRLLVKMGDEARRSATKRFPVERVVLDLSELYQDMLKAMSQRGKFRAGVWKRLTSDEEPNSEFVRVPVVATVHHPFKQRITIGNDRSAGSVRSLHDGTSRSRTQGDLRCDAPLKSRTGEQCV